MIYPLMGRLEAAELVRSVPSATGARRSRMYRVTSVGRRALARWVGPPLSDEVVGVPPDPLRMRVACLNVLPEAQRLALMRAMESRVRAEVLKSQRALRERRAAGNGFEFMASGAIAMQKTRLAWVRGVRRALADPRRGR